MQCSQQPYKADVQTSCFTDQEAKAAVAECHMAT